MSFASTSIRSFTVLTEDDGVPGSKLEREPEYYTVDQLKRWLKCRGLKQGGKREEILKRVKDCIFSGSHRTLDSFRVSWDKRECLVDIFCPSEHGIKKFFQSPVTRAQQGINRISAESSLLLPLVKNKK